MSSVVVSSEYQDEASVPVCVEDFDSDSILFRREFTSTEKLTLVNIIHHTLFDNTDAVSSAAYALSRCHSELSDLVTDIERQFVEQGQSSFFLRLSELSPKDAYFVLKHDRFPRVCQNEGFEGSATDEMTLEHLTDELKTLCVTSTESCLLLLTHSYRVFMVLEHDTTPMGNALLLLPWRGDQFWFASETRVFVRNGRVHAMSEYYSDLVKGYANVPALSSHAQVVRYCEAIVQFVESLVETQAIAATTVADVALLQSAPRDGEFIGHLLRIECNAYDDTVDTCLFDDFVSMEATDPTTCRWRDVHGTPIVHRISMPHMRT